MATFVTQKVKTVYHVFRFGNGIQRYTKRPHYTVYQISVDGVTKYIRIEGYPNIEIGTELDLSTLNYRLTDSYGNIIVDNSGGDNSGGGDDGGDDPDPIDGGGNPDTGGGDDTGTDPDPIGGGT